MHFGGIQEPLSLTPSWMAVVAYLICLVMIGIYGIFLYRESHLLRYRDTQGSVLPCAGESPLVKVINDMFPNFPGKVTPVMSIVCVAAFFVVPFILEVSVFERNYIICLMTN